MQVAYTVSYAAQTAGNLSLLTTSALQAHARGHTNGMLARACYSHHDSEKALFWTGVARDGTSQASGSTLEAMLSGKKAPLVH